MRGHAPAEHGREVARETDRVALHGDVDVEVLLAEEDVAHRASHEIDALGPLAERRHGIEDRPQPCELAERPGETLARLDEIRLEPFERAQEIRP